MRKLLFSLSLLLALPAPLIPVPVKAQNSDYLRKTDVDYSVFEKRGSSPAWSGRPSDSYGLDPQRPVDQGLFELDKDGNQTKASKIFQKGTEIYNTAKPILDTVVGIFGGSTGGFDLGPYIDYGEALLGRSKQQQQAAIAANPTADGNPLGDVAGVNGEVDPAKVRERVLSSIEAGEDTSPNTPFGISNIKRQMLLSDLAVTRNGRQTLELILGETGQQFSKESRDYIANLIKGSGELVDAAIKSKSTQDVEKFRAQIEANSQLITQMQFAEQQQIRRSVDEGNQAQLQQLEIIQQEKWEKAQREDDTRMATAQNQQLALSLVLPAKKGTAPKTGPQIAAKPAPSFITNRR